VNSWAVSEAMGKPRRGVREGWATWGLLRAAGADGLWAADELERIAHVKALESEARRLSRRALLLHRDGHRVEPEVRRRAMADVLRRMVRPSHKVAQVLWELQALDARYRPPARDVPLLRALELPAARWPEIPLAATDTLFDNWYQWADHVTPALAAVGAAKKLPTREELPYEERLSLALLTELLSENHVRNRLGLPTQHPRYGPPAGEDRRAGAPLLRGQLPPKRDAAK
jgi:hypothetical protein